MPNRRVRRAEVLYIDEFFVIYRNLDSEGPTKPRPILSMVQLRREEVAHLLKVGTNETAPLKPIVKYVESCFIPRWTSAIATNTEEILFDPSEYGLRVNSTTWENGETTMEFEHDPACERNRRVDIIRTDAIIERSNTILFLARLALLSMMDHRSSFIFSEDDGVLSCDLPIGMGGGELLLPPPKLASETYSRGYSFKHVGKYLRVTCAMQGTSRHIMACNLLTSIGNSEVGFKYIPAEGEAPEPYESYGYSDCIIHGAREGSLVACPACGRPVFKLTPGGSPACRHSHLNKAKKKGRIEEARHYIEAGLSIKEAAERSGLRYGQVEYYLKRNWGTE